MTLITSLFTDPDTTNPDWTIVIEQSLFSKARPRMTKSGHTYMPKEYKEAQRLMREQLREQWTIAPLECPVRIHLEMRGEGRGDPDNIIGAFLDAAVGIVFVDDRVKNLPKGSWEWIKTPKKESCWLIQLYRLA